MILKRIRPRRAALSFSYNFYAMRNSKRNKLIIYAALIGCVIIFSAHGIYTLNSVREQKNNFARKFIPIISNPYGSWKHNKTFINISGITSDTIYFQSSKAGTIIKSDILLTKFISEKYFSSQEMSVISHCQCDINLFGVFFFLGNKPAIYCGKINGMLNQYLFPRGTFIRSCAISDKEVVFKGFDTGLHSGNPMFFRGNMQTKQIIVENDQNILDTDGLIASDGLLNYDSNSHRLIYLYFYKNKFLCLDTTLHLIYTGNTIDTIARVNTKYAARTQNGFTTLTNVTPKRTVNNQCCVTNGLLFSNSYLKADNEHPSDFSSNDVIDIYRIVDGKYIGSFYVPKVAGHHLLKFKIENSVLVVLYRDVAESFHLNWSCLKKGAIQY